MEVKETRSLAEQKQRLLYIIDHRINLCKSPWNKGVLTYAYGLVESLDDDMEITEENMLDGASNWVQYSYDGLALIYNEDIAKTLCSDSEFKAVDGGRLPPNAHENWCDVQARALYQACEEVLDLKREYNI